MIRRIITGRLVTPGTEMPEQGSVLIEGERIAALGDEAEKAAGDAERIALDDLIVAPGIIDMGVFATDKPAFHFGGVTRAALMPDQWPCHDDPATIRFAARQGKPDFWVHPLAAATKGLHGLEMAEIALMKDAGARGVSTGRKWIADSGLMLRLMRYCAMLDLPLLVHAEDGGLSGNAVATDGETATRLGLKSAPAMSESLAIARDLMLLRESGGKLHFRQVTTRAGLDLIRRAKAEGLPVTAGITPAHLFLNDQAISDYRTFCRLTPPLRSEDDRLAAIEAVVDGTIDVIASGHDPRGPEDKRLPFTEAATGMAGAETLLALTLSLVRDEKIGMGRLFDCLASNPARILGIEAGKLAAGMEADIIGIDVDHPWQVDTARMAASAGNTPFDKLPVQGRARFVMKGGKRYG